MSTYLMALDAGTGSVRAVLFDTSGNQIGVVQKEWTHREDPRWPGSMPAQAYARPVDSYLPSPSW